MNGQSHRSEAACPTSFRSNASIDSINTRREPHLVRMVFKTPSRIL